ncbi:MAG: nitrate transporter [Desmonostoc vinosum HA7617-LM4]|jgi:NitT/TauT family transport system permease protein|nr:nitrate transporter [Desmonostoc vinosum HA7617-LM4]
MEPSIFLDVLASLQRLFVGYVPAAVLGSFVGYLIGINDTIYQAFRRIFQIPHSFPPIALLPITLTAFRENEPAAIIIVFLGTLWTIIINTAIGMRHFRRQENNFRVAIFHTFHALKVGIWVAWFTVIATEMLIGPKGLGFLAWDGYKSGNANNVLEAILYIGIIGFSLDQLLDVTGNILSQMVSDGKK